MQLRMLRVRDFLETLRAQYQTFNDIAEAAHVQEESSDERSDVEHYKAIIARSKGCLAVSHASQSDGVVL